MGKIPEEIFLQGRHTKEKMKIYSTSVVIREMKITTIMSDHLMSVRKAIMKKTRDNKFLHECGGKGTFVYWWWDYKFIQYEGSSKK